MTLVRLGNVAAAETWCRDLGEPIALVPTMGALHDGHLQLVRRARELADAVVVSIFVNPLQFDEPDDLAKYPRDFDRDAQQLESVGATMTFTGTLSGFFGVEDAQTIPLEDPGPAALGLEGDHRSGHFEGVATIVRRLFEVVRPSVAVFGEKDYQQTLVVRALAARLGFPQIEVHPIVREPDGLALSSRNARLAPAERERALVLSQALFAARTAWQAGERDAEALRTILRVGLEPGGLAVEYADVRDPRDFGTVVQGTLERARGLVAASVGDVRLIDTLSLDGSGA